MRRRFLRRRRGRQVIVHTSDDASIGGVLALDAADGLVLRAATYLEGEQTDVAGEIFVPAARVSFVQVVP